MEVKKQRQETKKENWIPRKALQNDWQDGANKKPTGWSQRTRQENETRRNPKKRKRKSDKKSKNSKTRKITLILGRKRKTGQEKRITTDKITNATMGYRLHWQE